MTLESIRRRFRANLESIEDVAFCEDRLFGAAGELKPFQIGEVKFFGHNPCQRCVVPTRDPDSGQGVAGFQKTFMEQRKKNLPEWSNTQRFNHFYRFRHQYFRSPHGGRETDAHRGASLGASYKTQHREKINFSFLSRRSPSILLIFPSGFYLSALTNCDTVKFFIHRSSFLRFFMEFSKKLIGICDA